LLFVYLTAALVRPEWSDTLPRCPENGWPLEKPVNTMWTLPIALLALAIVLSIPLSRYFV
jgi:hypothetical protein